MYIEWLANDFYPWVQNKTIQFPVVLFIYGHKSPINIEMADFCTSHQIILYCLPSHSSHILQLCDVFIYKPLTQIWVGDVRKYQNEHVGQFVAKGVFVRVFCSAWTQMAANTQAPINGVRRCGLCPTQSQKCELDETATFGTVPAYQARKMIPRCEASPIRSHRTSDWGQSSRNGERVGTRRPSPRGQARGYTLTAAQRGRVWLHTQP